MSTTASPAPSPPGRPVPAVEVVPVASPLHDPAGVDAVVSGLAPAVAGAGGRVRAQPSEGTPVAVLVVTGGTETRVLDVLAGLQEVHPGAPALLLAHPGHNSLPAALEALARIQQDGGRGRIVTIGAPTDERRLADAFADLAAWYRLRALRIGLVGDPSDWLVASSPAPAVVTATWGPTVVPVAITAALDGVAAAPPDAGTGLAADVTARAVHLHEPHRHDVDAAAAVAPVLTALVERERLDALTVRCFDLVTQAGTSGCLALSALNDTGVVAGCEGDLPSTVGLLWVQVLLGRTGWMANPAEADPSSGHVKLAHCTVPRSLVAGYELRSHFESGLGVAIAGDLPAGPVTVLRIGGRRLDRLWIADGEARPTTRREDLCRTQLDVDVPPGAVADLLDRPLGNHLVLVPGHHAHRLRGWWQAYVAPTD